MVLRSSTLALLLCVLIGPIVVHASLPAFDSAADPAYNSGWADGSNGGYGFGPWSITTNNDNTQHFAGTFIADAGASGVNSAIDTDGRAFGMYANTAPNSSGASVSAMRDFTGGPLQVGQSFSLQIAVNYRDGAKGVILNGGPPFGSLGGLFIGGFPEHYSLYVYDGTSTVSYENISYQADSLFSVTFTVTAPTELQIHLTRMSTAGFEDFGTISGMFQAGSNPTGFNLYYGSTAQYYPQDDLFFNNFTVSGIAVSEPSLLGLIAFGTILLGIAQFQRRRQLQ